MARRGWTEIATIVGMMLGSGTAAACAMIAYARYLSLNTPGKWALIGDSLAPVSGVLSALAMGAAVASVIIQTRELAEARKAQRDAADDADKFRRTAEIANAIALLREEVAIVNGAVNITDQHNFARAWGRLKRLQAIRESLNEEDDAEAAKQVRDVADAAPSDAMEVEMHLAALLVRIDLLREGKPGAFEKRALDIVGSLRRAPKKS